MNRALRLAVKKAGGFRPLARRLRIKHHSVILQWKRVPPNRAISIEKIYGISKSDLRPDLWPKPKAPKPQGGLRNGPGIVPAITWPESSTVEPVVPFRAPTRPSMTDPPFAVAPDEAPK
jgi:Putative antitoxin of bacterial toxin-antitoxin system, YdaS/YdaT